MLNDTTTLVKTYKEAVKKAKTTMRETIRVEDYFAGGDNKVKLRCWYIKEENKHLVKYLRGNFEGGYQYDLRSSGLGRPKAWRVPFLDDPNYDNPDYTVSHLCHDSHCYNWRHHTFEPLHVNKARNGCPGGNHCHHKITCIRPGPYYNC